MIERVFEKQFIKKYAQKFQKLAKNLKNGKKFLYNDAIEPSGDVTTSGVKFQNFWE